MGIVRKRLCDVIPKAITLNILNELSEFIKFDLLAQVVSDRNGHYVSIVGVKSGRNKKW